MPASAAPVDAQDCANRMNACKIQAEGTQRLYDAAMVLKDFAEADRLRTRLHELLDLELDYKSSMYSIIQRSYSNRHK